MGKDNLYDEEVECWLVNHSFVFTFFWGMKIMVCSFIFIPLEVYLYAKKLKETIV